MFSLLAGSGSGNSRPLVVTFVCAYWLPITRPLGTASSKDVFQREPVEQLRRDSINAAKDCQNA